MNILITDQINSFLCEDVGYTEGFEYPTTRPVIEDIPAREGALYLGSQFGRRPLSWQGTIKGLDVLERRRNLIKACRVGYLKTIQFTTKDNLDLQAEVEILKILMPYQYTAIAYLIEAVAPDFRFYSQTLYTQASAVTQFQGGTPIPAAIPAPIGGGSNLTFEIVNNGNIYSNPIFTIQGSGTEFIVNNITTGESFTIDLTLQAGESVVVDTNERTAFQGNQNVFGAFTGDWMRLDPGSNFITFNVGTGKTSETELSVSFRDAYIGL